MRAALHCAGSILVVAAALAAACADEPKSPSTQPLDDAGATDDGGLPPLESSPPGLIPQKDRRDAVSSPVVFDRLRGGAWTANGDAGSITYADVDAQRVVHETAIGKNVTSVALSPDFKWIAAVDRDGAGVALVDAESAQPKRTIPLGTHPRAAVWDAVDPRWLYVSLEDDGAIAVVDRTLGVLHHTVPVGRIPAGLAVSRHRRELAVTHRIDARVTILPVDGVYAPADQGEPLVEVPLADEPPGSVDTVPNGRPFAFDALAWAPDGNVVWLPHELLADHHPFQFQRNLFPAVSVADLSARAEVQTDPNDPNGVIAGRKLLFAAINILDPVGNASVVSQPCAAAIHPNGLVAWAVACASEDLVTFDLTSGAATSLLRNLPGDHPAGMTLDDTGQRAFVVSDQSHTLLTLDLAGGSPVGHARAIAPPLALVAKDPVDPEMRQGLKLFFGANSQKGTLPATGNDWMSCGGCHLDGFVSTNEVFFEALSAADPSRDAQIGHSGLKDLFSTAPTPEDPSFDPHDILVALLDQGGLAPDRTGANRAGQVDPAHPTPSAVAMAEALARVVERDLPAGPAWLLSPGDKPNLDWDAQFCGKCHTAEYQQWQKSAHAHSAQDPMVKFGLGVEQAARGPQYARQCAGCHDPVSMRAGDTSFASGRGITCLGCHDVTRLIRAGGNSDIVATAHADWNAPSLDHKIRAKASLALLRTPDFCAGCHQQFVPGNGISAIDTLGEWLASPFAPQPASSAGADAGPLLGDAGATSTRTCVDCHMPDDGFGEHDHAAVGGNVYVAQQFGVQDLVPALTKRLKSAVQLEAYVKQLGGDGTHVIVKNVGAGHAFPTGVTDIREPWVEVQAVDGSSNVVARYGGPDSSGLLSADSGRLGMDIAQPDGTLLYRHELTDATRVPFARFVPSRGAIEIVVPTPGIPPQGAVEFEAVLYYRNVRTQYYRAATGDPSGHAPDVEVARVPVGTL